MKVMEKVTNISHRKKNDGINVKQLCVNCFEKLKKTKSCNLWSSFVLCFYADWLWINSLDTM